MFAKKKTPDEICMNFLGVVWSKIYYTYISKWRVLKFLKLPNIHYQNLENGFQWFSSNWFLVTFTRFSLLIAGASKLKTKTVWESRGFIYVTTQPKTNDHPANIWIFKVINRNTRKSSEIFSKLTIKKPRKTLMTLTLFWCFYC